MPKPKLTDEQKRAKAVKQARWGVVAWPIGFALYFGLLCWYFIKRYDPSSTFDSWEAVQMSMGLLLPAYGFADAKYTLRTNGKELGSLGYAVALLLFNGVSFVHNVSKHGFPTHFWPLLLGTWLLMVPIVVWKIFQLRCIRAAQRSKDIPAAKQ